jgi:hypothetical protein
MKTRKANTPGSKRNLGNWICHLIGPFPKTIAASVVKIRVADALKIAALCTFLQSTLFITNGTRKFALFTGSP